MGWKHRLEQAAMQMIRDATPMDPAVFDDPVATATSWLPLQPGGASFRTHTLTSADPDHLVLTKTLGTYIFGLVFALVGLGVALGSAAQGVWPGLLFSGVFLAAATWILWPRSVVFDRSARQFRARGEVVSFSTIGGVQILRERVPNKRSSFYSYELNLVLKDALRLPISDHSDLRSIRQDAEKIRRLVGCKLWDATAVHPEATS